MSKLRFTIHTESPDSPAPMLRCPSCDELLRFRVTVVGGVKPVERWDYYDCVNCGCYYKYRSRTRKLLRSVELV
jgi:hypothetical protein